MSFVEQIKADAVLLASEDENLCLEHLFGSLYLHARAELTRFWSDQKGLDMFGRACTRGRDLAALREQLLTSGASVLAKHGDKYPNEPIGVGLEVVPSPEARRTIMALAGLRVGSIEEILRTLAADPAFRMKLARSGFLESACQPE